MSETINSSMEVEENKKFLFECIKKNQEQVFSPNSSSSISGQFTKFNKNSESGFENSEFYMDVEKTSNAKPGHDTNLQQTSENVTTVEYEPLETESLVLYECDRIDEDSDENLPNGWINITHTSGMPLYLHKETRVCSFAKPYFIGINSLRNHDVPLASIPCLNHKLKSQKTNLDNNDGNLNEVPEVVTSKELHEYCKKLFRFKIHKGKMFKSWKQHREYQKKKKNDMQPKTILKQIVPSRFVFLPQLSKETNKKNENKDDDDGKNYITLQLNNKEYTDLLHEYAQKKLRTIPSYKMKVLDKSKNYIMATVLLHGIQYGTGAGSSHKIAKQYAAKSTFDILIPSAENRIKVDRQFELPERQDRKIEGNTFFDKLLIIDPMIPEYCRYYGELLPFDLLNICIKRNFGIHEKVKYRIKHLKNMSDGENCYKFVVSIQNHSTTVFCNNKSEGHQKGAQALLQVLHPHVDIFGSMLKLYSHSLNIESIYDEKNEKPDPLLYEKQECEKKVRRPNEKLLANVRAAMSSPQTKLY